MTATLSAELYAIPLDDNRFLVYAPLRQIAFVGNARLVNFLADLQSGITNHEIDSDDSTIKFLQGIGLLEPTMDEPPIVSCKGKPRPVSVTLLLTTACNLRCSYCYASAGDAAPQFMPLEAAQRGIDFIIRNAVKNKKTQIGINYHGGGEPTMHWEVLQHSLAYGECESAKRNIAVTASMATNGVLQKKQIDWIISHMRGGVSVSFDGLPAAHDKYRKTASGKGSSSKVIHTLRKFDEARYPYGIRMTVTSDRIPTMADSVEYICSNFHPRRIQLEPAYQMGRWAGAPSAETEAFVAGFRDARHRAKRYGHELFFSAARLGLLSNHFCGVSQDSFVVSAKGNVTACYEAFNETAKWSSIFFYGTPGATTGGYDFDMKKLNRLRKLSVENRKHCIGCFARWSCAGDCYYKSLNHGEKQHSQHSDRCFIIRELTKDQILSRISDAGGIFWHEPSFINT